MMRVNLEAPAMLNLDSGRLHGDSWTITYFLRASALPQLLVPQVSIDSCSWQYDNIIGVNNSCHDIKPCQGLTPANI